MKRYSVDIAAFLLGCSAAGVLVSGFLAVWSRFHDYGIAFHLWCLLWVVLFLVAGALIVGVDMQMKFAAGDESQRSRAAAHFLGWEKEMPETLLTKLFAWCSLKRRLRPAPKPDEVAWQHYPMPLGSWLAGHGIATENRSAAGAEIECEVSGLLTLQLSDCDQELAGSLCQLFCALAKFAPDVRAFLVRQVSDASWRNDGRNAKQNVINLCGEVKARFCTDEETAVMQQMHAFPVTRMMSAFEAGTGAMVVSDFIWLRNVDPVLWYALQNVGRASFFVEGLGPVSHYLAEKAARTAIRAPAMADSARAVVSHISTYTSPEPSPSRLAMRAERDGDMILT